MKIIISPAKKLNTNISVSNQPMNFRFMDESKELISILQRKSALELKKLMTLSDNLSHLNWKRFQEWNISNTNTYKALELFNGAVYEGINVSSFSDMDHKYAENNLRILSGLYGILKPQDMILPYRLEMGTKLENNKGNNLYSFWEDKLLLELELDLNGSTLVNLASNEYSKALKLKNLENTIISPVFKDFKNGKLKVISFFAKKARGEMVKFIIQNKIMDYNDLKLFKNNGYSFSHSHSGEMFFHR